ncbi:MAG: hypothetical protein CSB55_05680 [Candidatus Cloacimonadota bacterium]|nr:MAG: hypothetical protein CSB55_05680 [Candidatus Cloacimonadota bacterium]
MKEFPRRRIKFFEEQYWYSQNFLQKYLDISDYENLNILETGSAEGGSIKFFSEQKANCWGVEISKGRSDFSIEYCRDKNINFICGDICKNEIVEKLPEMDIIIIRDVIEHIPDKITALKNMNRLLKKDGKLFLSYPPKYSPYAGHQQNVKKIIGRLPFIHLLPKFIYRIFLKAAQQTDQRIEGYMDVKRDMISIRKIENYFKRTNYKILKKDYYFIRPCFEKRFGWKPRKLFLSKIPILKEMFTVGALYVLGKKTQRQ